MTGQRGRDALAVVRGFAERAEIDCEAGERDGELVLVLPGDHKLATVVSVLAGEHDLSVSAFVVRHPDENHEAVYRLLLRRNLRTPGLAYAIDDSGDVFVVGRLPYAAVDEDGVDRLLGATLSAADDIFDTVLTTGFLTSMKREWAWRVSRGESLRNLEPFRDVLEGSEREGDPD